MARKNVTFIQTVSGPNLIALDEIPQDVKDFVEDAYKNARKTDGRVHAEYETKAELELEFKQMASYCAQRKAGVLKIRKSPTRNLPDNVMEFRVSADLPANGARNDGNDRRQPVGA